MEKLDDSFKIDYKNAMCDTKKIFKGSKYRISVLSDTLLRLEYDESGVFEDRPTELAINRKFPLFDFDVQENSKYLVITTKYYRLQYIKDKPFVGSLFAPDSALRVALLDTDKSWYYGHDEARNYGGYENSVDTRNPSISRTDNKVKDKATYLGDSFVIIDKNQVNIQIHKIIPKLKDENGIEREYSELTQYMFAVYVPKEKKYFVKG